MSTYQYTRTTPSGATKSVGSLKSPREAQRFIAHALVDNGYTDRADAAAFARTVTLKSGPLTHAGSGMTYSISQEGP